MISSRDSNIKRLTTSAIIAALSVGILITGIIPGAFYVSIFLAICISVVILNEYGIKYWSLCYITTSLLAMILSPDLEITLTFIGMGWYTPVKKTLDKLVKAIRIILKTIIYVLSSYFIYHISIIVFGGLEEDIPYFVIFYIIIFSIDFMLLDFSINLTQYRVIPMLRRRKIK